MDDIIRTDDVKDNLSEENWEDCDGTERDPMMYLYQKFLKGKKFNKWCYFYYDVNMEHRVTNTLDPRIFFCAKSCVVELDHVCDIPVLNDIVRNVSDMSFNDMFWILRNCLVLKKLVVKESSTGKGITLQQKKSSTVKGITAQHFFSQMTKRNEKFRNFIKSLELHYNNYDHAIGSEEGDKILLFLQQNKSVKNLSFIGKNFGDKNAKKLALSILSETPGISLHLKDDAITVTGFSCILSQEWMKRGMDIKFEIPLSKEILNFLLEYFKDEEHLDMSYFELKQYQGSDEIDEKTEECRELLGDLREILINWRGVSSYKFDGFGVTFDSEDRETMQKKKKIKTC